MLIAIVLVVAPGLGSAPPWAELFEKGRTWTLHGTYTSAVETNAGNFTCTAGAVTVLPFGSAVQIDCTPPPSSPLSRPAVVGGLFVMTPAGLWNPDEMPATAAALDPQRMLFAAAPVARDQLYPDANDRDHGFKIENTSADGKTWCVSEAWSAGDNFGRKRCFTPGVGLTSGSSWFVAGSSTELVYETADAPVDPADCTRADASQQSRLPALGRFVTSYSVARDRAQRALIQSFVVANRHVTSTTGGCAHAGQQVRLHGMGKASEAEIVEVLRKLPGEDFGILLDSLVSPDPKCANEVREPSAGRLLSCADARVTFRRDGDDACLDYDFPL